MFSVLITLMITFTSQHVQSKVITVNTNEGSESTKCCIQGDCLCSSLSFALNKMEGSNTIVNITSEAIALNDNIEIGSDNLNNITITSQMTTITCSNTTIYCGSCDNVMISGITWIYCNLALSNSTVVNCTLMHSNFLVLGSISIERSVSSLSSPLWINNTNHTGYVNLTISGSTFYSLMVSDSSCLAQWNITIINTILASGTNFTVPFNRTIFNVCADVLYGVHMANSTVGISWYFSIMFNLKVTKGDVNVSVLSSVFYNNDNALQCIITSHSEDSSASILITDTEFINNGNFGGGSLYYYWSLVKLAIISNTTSNSTITFNNVNFTNHRFKFSTQTLSIEATSLIKVYMTNVNIIGNEYNDNIESSSPVLFKIATGLSNQLVFHQCKFIDNQLPRAPSLLLIYSYDNAIRYTNNHSSLIVSNCSIINNTISNGIYFSEQAGFYIEISNTAFDYNTVESYIIFVVDIEFNDFKGVNITGSNFIGNNVKLGCMSIPEGSEVLLMSSQFINNTGITVSVSKGTIDLTSSNFTNNIGGCIQLLGCALDIRGTILFDSNSAVKGAGLNIDQVTRVYTHDGSTVQFLNNSATLGGAIFVDSSGYCGLVFILESYQSPEDWKITFKDNVATAGYNGDSLYFSVSKGCNVNTNTSDPTSLMYIPYRFHYSELRSTNCCEVSCSNQHNTKFPVITSPHYLILCGNNIKQLDNVTYFIGNVVLGKSAVFEGSVMDYFKKPSQSIQFSLNCVTCPNDIKLSSRTHILVDSASPLTLKFSGNKIKFNNNVTVKFASLLDENIWPIEAQIVVEIVPCFNHIGYVHRKESNGCTCYHSSHSVVKCSDYYNEIEDGYWIGVIASQPTTSLCPARYCSFIHRNKFTLGYSELPDKVDAQCNHHRRGRACGECSPRYTLAYDTTDCISVNHCSTILTVIVVVATCVYWLIIVVGVFALLYFNKRIPLGYTYGIIYYYSMVGILFNNNPYVSESAFLFISVMSSFTQLSPQFLGKLCLVKGLSGIDQLFIHYSHAAVVSMLVVMFVIAAKFSGKLSTFVSRCRIVRIICLLLLLSYTSIASTSLQLLRPLTFTDIKEVYTYSSPSIQYFHDRHALYGIVAIVCELLVGIGLPLLLLLEPFVNKKINFVKIKPLLDEFQNCYKDKKMYRWFASYYLICRQIILLIVFVGNGNYNRMLFFLQFTCTVIATIHMWIQPYKSTSLNLFDGMILLIMVVSISINIFSFLQPAATELVLIFVILPLFIICIVGIRQLIKRKYGGGYVDNEEDMARFVTHRPTIASCLLASS